MRDSCLTIATAAARALRLGLCADGNQRVLTLVTELGHYFATEEGMARGVGIAPVLPAIIASQERGDDIAVADLIEHELAPRL